MRYAWLLLLALTVACAAEPTGLVNGSFELDENRDGVPDGWQVSGNAGVEQALGLDTGADGQRCAVLQCTKYTSTTASSHAMLCQVDQVKLTRGQWYRFQVRLRGEGIPGASLSVAISNTKQWSNCGLNESVFVSPEWRLFETQFQATQSIREGTRLQLWWTTTGTVWFDDIELEPCDPPRRRYTEQIAETKARNQLPNSGFEAGAAGWGSITDVPGWGGNLNRLYGEVVTDQPHSGQHCLKLELSPEQRPTVWFDYFELIQVPVTRLLAANRGWVSIDPGQPYVLSAWLRAAADGTPALLRVNQSGWTGVSRSVTVGTTWQRFELPFKAGRDQAYVQLGLDLGDDLTARGTLFIDDVMLEAADAASPYEPRAALEVGAGLSADGGLYEPGQPMTLNVGVANSGAAVALPWKLTVTDYRDQVVARASGTWRVPAGEGLTTWATVEGLKRGFYRLKLEAEGADISPPLPLRAVIEPFNQRNDTVCGMNHGYPTGDLLELSRKIGLGWFRDWSYKWHDLEPTKGTWTFAGADAQVDRVLEHKLHVLALLPFPSAVWSSSGKPPEGKQGYEAARELVSYAPKDPLDLANYVQRTAAHLQGRVDTFEIFNEPVYTSYSLPQKFGYTPADYAKHLAICAKAVRAAQPEATIIGGIQSGPESYTKELIDAGGLNAIDALSLHTYPGRTAPENYVQGFENLRAWMADAGHAELPLWWTEGAYYADDDEPIKPYQSWLKQLPDERLCADFTIRLNAILCGHNTQRIIYHSGTPGSINNESLAGIYYEYDGLPHKLNAALATFNEFIGPGFQTRGRAPAADDVYAYQFDTDGRTVVIAWCPMRQVEVSAGGDWQAFDILGNPVAGTVTLSDEPVYLINRTPGQTPALTP